MGTAVSPKTMYNLPMNDRIEIFAAVTRERNHQIHTWGSNPHSVGEWLLILQAELDEAKEAWVKNRGDIKALEEILQVVAVGVACMEEHGVVERT